MAFSRSRAIAPEKPAGVSSDAVTVTEALTIAKGALNGVRLKIVGEVSYVSNKSTYSAVYFSVKDEGGTLECMVWKDRYAAIGVELPHEGVAAVGENDQKTGQHTQQVYPADVLSARKRIFHLFEV